VILALTLRHYGRTITYYPMKPSAVYGWRSASELRALDRDSVRGVNEINRDYVLVTLGDATAAHDQMPLAVEGEPGSTRIDTAAGQFVNAWLRR